MRKQILKKNKISSKSPAKVILSGEYSTLYGGASLAMAVSLYLKASIEIIDLPIIRIIKKKPVSYSLEEYKTIASRIDHKYKDFLAGFIPITDVLNRTDDLILYILHRNINDYPITGLSISIDSMIPIGRGFGSSSAIISALSLVLREITNKPFQNKDDFIKETGYIERLQHGKYGLIDSTTIIKGGVIYINNSNITQYSNIEGEWWAVDTGEPESFTGECVSFIDKNFSKSVIWNEFNSVTNNIIDNIQKKDLKNLYDNIRNNHYLLQSINVVPPLISKFISSIEYEGGSAKISGAGSIKGEKAGLVLVAGYDPRKLSSLYGYTCHKIKGEKNGTILTESLC
ncbi:Mevalonate kinase [Candidatus Liberibacter americanus str. Sao Paulo]|uniref:Mevalonate kinase n=1 Tax=Candidatus Liberibacter americanus str. Sao Paulo TaxID=1261131 RepID=U6B877_9HYPH|nr:Mevalonate kinase [Candidatus Liberibacter americanus str. Sao Paulo]